MSHVKSIPKGSQVLEQLNFFIAEQCNHMKISGFEMDGLGRGDVFGHTIYCGFLAYTRSASRTGPGSRA